MRNKKTSLALFILLIIVLAIIPVIFTLSKLGVFSVNKTAKTESTATITADTLVCVADADYYPYSFINEAGNPDGMDADIAIELGNRLGKKAKLELYDWETCKEIMKNGQADLILGLNLPNTNSEVKMDYGSYHDSLISDILNDEYEEMEPYVYAAGALPSIGASLQNPILCAQIEQTAKEMFDDGTIPKLYNKWIGINIENNSFEAVILNYAPFYVVYSILSIILIALYIFCYLLSRRRLRTEESRRKDELHKASLARAIEMADSANEAKTNFLFNMSHDIRTPMNAIIGYTVMAKKYLDSKDKVTDCLDKIDISGQQLLSLVNQVLDMSKIESGKMTIEEAPADLIERASALLMIVEASAKAKGITLEGKIKNIRNKDILTDTPRVNQVFINILGNAIKYTPEGGKIIYTAEQISDPVDGVAKYRFTVEDNGIGMSKEYLTRIFDSFSREHNTTNSGIEGTGLGMAIVKKIVDMLGGKIDIESKQGFGTKVVVTVDFKIQDISEMAQENVIEVEEDAFQGKRILLVEDNEMNREIARDILEDYGIYVEEADDGDTAVSMVKNSEHGFYNAILMDVQMPRMNGYEATMAIRELEDIELASIPIIAMTANAFEEDRKRALAVGMNEHLSKPIDITKLVQTLDRFII